jgi:hypothetical protein
MRRLMRRWMLSAAGLGLLVVTAGRAEANIIFNVAIDDTSGGVPQATINGVPVTLLPDSNGEFIHFHVSLGGTIDGSQITIISGELLDANGSLSDQVLITNPGGQTFSDVQFASSPATLTIPPGTIDTVRTQENGSQQLMGLINDSLIGGIDFTVRVTAASTDVSTTVVPEPSTAVVAVFGAVSGIAYGLARKRRAQRRQDQEGTSEQTQ